MPRKSAKRSDYQCIRCGYETGHKASMRRHLYDLKNVCPGEKNNIELTEEIKQDIMENRIYHIPKERQETNINFNTLNKFIINMDLPDKINYWLGYQPKELIDIEDDMEQHFKYRLERLESDKFQGGYFLSENDIFNLINKFTKIDHDHLERFNVYFNKTVKRFRLFRGTSWEDFLEETGAKEMVSLIKSYFLNNYEEYIIKHLHGDNVRNLNRVQLQEHLEIYYRFIATFDLIPYVCDLDDMDILGHKLVDNNETYLAEKYMRVYCKEKTRLKFSEKNRVKKRIISIIKENTLQNISEINKVLCELLQVNNEFRQQLIDSLKANQSPLIESNN